MATNKHPNNSLDAYRGAARVLYESDPSTTLDRVAAELAVPVDEVRRWKAEENWSQAPGARTKSMLARSSPDKSSEDREVDFDNYETRALDALNDSAIVASMLDSNGAAQYQENILARHRAEWSAPRQLLMEAIERGDIERAKLAKLSAETLALVQAGEEKAWRLKSAPKTVIIDRESSDDT